MAYYARAYLLTLTTTVWIVAKKIITTSTPSWFITIPSAFVLSSSYVSLSLGRTKDDRRRRWRWLVVSVGDGDQEDITARGQRAKWRTQGQEHAKTKRLFLTTGNNLKGETHDQPPNRVHNIENSNQQTSDTCVRFASYHQYFPALQDSMIFGKSSVLLVRQ